MSTAPRADTRRPTPNTPPRTTTPPPRARARTARSLADRLDAAINDLLTGDW